MCSPLTLSWAEARAIARGALDRSYREKAERQALARIIAHTRTRPRECVVWGGSCLDCPHLCPLDRKDDEDTEAPTVAHLEGE